MASRKRNTRNTSRRGSSGAAGSSARRSAGSGGKSGAQSSSLILAAVAGLCVFAILVLGSSRNRNQSQPQETEEPVQTVAGDYFADIAVQDYGTITVALDASAAPITVANFVSLAESGFYDGLTFHRIMDGFMMQGGDPTGTGSGGSEDLIEGEFTANGHENPISHLRGTISMARRSGDNNSASSQFFIVQSDSTFLDGQYAAFGHVTEGMDLVDRICADANPIDDNGTISPEDQPVITSVTIREA